MTTLNEQPVAETTAHRFSVQGLSKRFGNLVVADDIHLDLAPGARMALIGPNGAGKSTFVNLVTGMLTPSSGRIVLDGEDITTMSASRRVRNGLVRSFQVTRLFKELTVADNIRLAVLQERQQYMRLFSCLANTPGLDEEVQRILDELKLSDRASNVVHNLAYGEQRLVEIALVLALKPKVLLLD
ncbi:MAG: ATP-binding cassette domain-containing protein, partial [Pseudohongiella sp.]